MGQWLIINVYSGSIKNQLFDTRGMPVENSEVYIDSDSNKAYYSNIGEVISALKEV